MQKLNTGTESEPESRRVPAYRMHQRAEPENRRESPSNLIRSRDEIRERSVDFHNLLPVGYLALDAEGLINEINPAGAEMLGVSAGAASGRNFSTSVAAEQAELWHRYFAKAQKQDGRLDCELQLMRPDGSRIDVRLDSLHLPDSARTSVLHVVLTDITEWKRADRAFNASEQRFHDLVNSTNGIVWEADATTFTFTFISQQAETLLGFPVTDWLNPGFWIENLHPDDRSWAPEYCASCTSRLEPHDFEYRFITRDGRTVWLHDIVTVVAEAGAPRWLRGIMVDVTGRKEAEAQLREMAAHLEAKVAERTMQLRSLSADLTMTEERERKLLAQDLHDNLGQILAVIKIKLTSLASNPTRHDLDEIVGLVSQADKSVRAVTQQLSPPILQAMGLLPALDWLADEMTRVYGITVHLDNATCGKKLRDEVQAMLYRSVRELLINVARHAKSGEASLSCVCFGNRLMLVVGDDGCGFDAGDLEHFRQGEGGFGLHSIYERVTSIGGDMEIDSCPGKGTTVSLTVPCSSCIESRSQ